MFFNFLGKLIEDDILVFKFRQDQQREQSIDNLEALPQMFLKFLLYRSSDSLLHREDNVPLNYGWTLVSIAVCAP